jgi:hypothetical protein
MATDRLFNQSQGDALIRVLEDIRDQRGAATEAEISDIVNVYGAKNLLPIDYPSSTKNGITFTVNADGSITANGTATANAAFQLVNKSNYSSASWESLKNIISGKTIILSGCPSGGSASKYSLRKWGQSSSGTYADYGDGVEFTPTESSLTDYYWDIEIVIYSGQTVNNLTFKPMIRLASIQDNTYVPYAKTNQQLTEETTALLDNLEVNGAVNMLPTDIATQVFKGATITHNSDGSYSIVKSTADSQSGSVLSTAFTLKAGTYYWSASQHGHSAIGSNDCYCFIKGINGTVDWYRSTDFDVNHKWGVITLTQDSSIQFGIAVGTGTSNITFYPMITVASYNGDYVPYAKSNKELTEDVESIEAMYDGKSPSVVSDCDTPLNVGGSTFAINRFSSSSSNIPGGSGALLTWSSSAKYGAQIAFNDAGLFYRKNSNGIINAWQNLTT